ncbi:hypothetical protein Q5424_01140 [Conexibacter sp. JD483]|uniref:hypothetical protein n=1 Tax=unclassified Conexibacter TaxID=2627773 RepID=UPI002720DA0E|nr:MULTISPECIES: hypothetical protein [unclassified Conexibacter]MDO8185833.1 hypothetical protein [Conexibacter sp. CPCC 205706]MDO8198577.1 hypothetical protein [Conexibacter sp. CPCC 205762]MDR9367663.1 hypothetical protein [Conexibacter sp. JD483]
MNGPAASAPRRGPRTSSRPSAPRRFSWAVGVGVFGDITFPSGERQLIETVRMTESEAVVVDLADGARRVFDYTDGHHLFTPVTLEVAADRAGMPAPVTLAVGDMLRRIDPFHSERHLNARFRALNAMIFDRRLPCAYSLLLAARRAWGGRYDGAHGEDPEQTAANVATAIARQPELTVHDALANQLAQDSGLTDDPSALRALLDDCGWTDTLADLDHLLVAHADAEAYPVALLSQRPPEPAPTASSGPDRAPAGQHEQLSLL